MNNTSGINTALLRNSGMAAGATLLEKTVREKIVAAGIKRGAKSHPTHYIG
jgi:hypothetical protein